MSTKPSLKYPYNWGRTVIQTFVEKYARGTYYLAKLLDISPGEVRHGLIMLLCLNRNLEFESVKRMIKIFQEEGKDIFSKFSVAERATLYEYYKKLCIYDEIDEKDGREALDRGQNHSLDY